MSDQFYGIVTATATPFNADYSLDERALREHIEWYIQCGVHGISVAGSQGEFYALNSKERLRVIEIAAETINGRVPLYAGTGAATTAESIAITKSAVEIGVDIAMLITPFFVHPSDDELVDHFSAIANSTTVPVVLYNNPPRTGVNISAVAYSRCIEVKNIVGIKDSSGDMTQIGEYLRMGGRQNLVFSGRDTLLMSTIMQGGVGGISPAANVFPRLMLKLYDAAFKGNFAAARQVNDILSPLRIAWELGSFPVVIKEAMALVGRSSGPARLPIARLSDDRRNQLKEIVATIAKHEASAQAVAS